MSTKRVLAAVSGGVDSSVAVHLLRQQGYEVEGVILEFSPAHRAAVESARVIAEQMKMPLHVIECHREFEENVILPFCREYREGRTPNPCILCNPSTKFALICKAAAELGFDFVATGHYARVEHQSGGTAVLRKSDCLERDQSYMLYRLTQQQLSMLLLPLEGLEKTQVRQIAHQLGLACADAPDSQEICWLPDGDYASFIEQKLGSCPAGEFISPDGTVCGQHKGLLHYTVGQRKGLGAFGRPMFVTRIVPEQNAVILGENGAQYAKEFTVEGINAISAQMSGSFDCDVKIRFRAPAAPAHVEFDSKNTARVTFFEEQRSVTPGQFASFYIVNEVIGGAKIAGFEAQRIL